VKSRRSLSLARPHKLKEVFATTEKPTKLGDLEIKRAVRDSSLKRPLISEKEVCVNYN
jgi:hypothetical protein